MFSVGDKIVYGSDGVFVVAEHSASPIDKKDERVFYVLKPLNGPEGNLIYAPAEGGSVRMRPVISRDEAERFIETIPDIGEIIVEKEKQRRESYKNAMIEGGVREYVSIIKTVWRRREEFVKSKRRLSEADTEYENRAKNCLYGELSAALEIKFSEVEEFITNRINSAE